MHFSFSFLFPSLVALLLAGCAGDEPAASPVQKVTQQNQSFFILSGSVEQTPSGLRGTSVVLAAEAPLTHEMNRFNLEFMVDEGGSFSVLSNGGTELSGAARVQLTRESGTLKKAVLSMGNLVLPIDFTRPVDATGQVLISVEVHIEGDGTHVVIFHGGEELGELEVSRQLIHRNWGVAMENSTLSSVTVVEAHH